MNAWLWLAAAIYLGGACYLAVMVMTDDFRRTHPLWTVVVTVVLWPIAFGFVCVLVAWSALTDWRRLRDFVHPNKVHDGGGGT